jgi:hypothetical protein
MEFWNNRMSTNKEFKGIGDFVTLRWDDVNANMEFIGDLLLLLSHGTGRDLLPLSRRFCCFY